MQVDILLRKLLRKCCALPKNDYLCYPKLRCVHKGICKLIYLGKYLNWIALRQNKPYKHYFRKHK